MEVQELFKRIDYTRIYPPFLAHCEAMIQELMDSGVLYYATSGFRSVQEQDALYARGRILPGRIVTKARGGSSAHQFGCAIDFARDGDVNKIGLQPIWDHAAYKALGEATKNHNIEWGGTWISITDLPHCQLPLKANGILLRELKAIYDDHGLQGVWDRLDQVAW